MKLVKVDHIGSKSPQRLLHLLQNPRPAGVAKGPFLPPAKPELGRDQRLAAMGAFGQGAADNFLGMAESVNRSGVDQRDAVIERGMNRADRLPLIRTAPLAPADRPSSKRDATR